MKKYIILLIVLILIVVISAIFISKPEYTLSEISKLVDKSGEIPDNIYIREERIDPAGTNITEIYKKDKVIFEHFYKDDMPEYEDIIWDFNLQKHIQIDYIFRNIYVEEIQGKGNTNPVNRILIGFSEMLKEEDRKYRYCGKENIDGKECIKFSLTSKNDEKTYYFVDIQNGVLYKKIEGTNYNNNFNELFTTTYAYSYNTVTDEDILKFEINNYPDYNIQDFSK